MPALNIIAIQETVRNSGFSSSSPSGIWPKRLIASQSAKTTNAVAASTNNQPILVMTHFCAVLAAEARPSSSRTPQATKASAPIAVAQKMSRSSRGLPGDPPATSPPGGGAAPELPTTSFDMDPSPLRSRKLPAFTDVLVVQSNRTAYRRRPEGSTSPAQTPVPRNTLRQPFVRPTIRDAAQLSEPVRCPHH